MPKKITPKQGAKEKLARVLSKKDELLSAIRIVGDFELARSYAGINKEEAVTIPEEEIIQARAEYDKARVDDAAKLRTRARDFALLTEDVKDMLTVADWLCPELGLYPSEKARAKAKSEHSSPQIQINLGMAQLGDRLQQALKNMPATAHPQLPDPIN